MNTNQRIKWSLLALPVLAFALAAQARGGNGLKTQVGTANVSFIQGAIGTYYATFDAPIKFTAKSTRVAVRIINTGWLRLNISGTNQAPGDVLKNSATGAVLGGPYPNFPISLDGTVLSPSGSPPPREPRQVAGGHWPHDEWPIPFGLRQRRPGPYSGRGIERAAGGSYSLSQRNWWGAISSDSMCTSLLMHSPLLCSI